MQLANKKSWYRIPLWVVLAFLMWNGYVYSESLALETTLAESSKKKGFVLLELYTSEGCSSCPPADKLLRKIVQNARDQEGGLVGISLHVDYWNYLGWEDPYSKQFFADRQKFYQQQLRLRSRYTPQMIINGSQDCLGSKASCLKSAISEEWKKERPFLEAQVNRNNNQIIVTPSITSKNTLWVALLEKEGSQNVTTGENSGRVLTHFNIVRQLIPFAPNTEIKVTIPKVLQQQKIGVVVWEQNKEGEILSGNEWSL